MKTTGSRASAVSQTRGFGDLLYDKAGARPSLDLDFAGTSSLRDKITGEYLVDHTRGTTGTYIDSEGLVKEAPINYLPNSTNPTLWGKGSNTTLTANAFTAPDGTQTAHRVQFSAGQGTYLALPAGAIVAGETYVYSIWLKKNGSNTTTSLFINGATTVGESSANPHYQVTLTDEWQRFTRVFTVSNSSLIVQIDNWNSQAEDFLFWHPQVEKGSVATDYITTTSVPNSAPRFTHERVETGNLLINSERLWNGADWNKRSGDVVTRNFALAPDGKFSATKYTIGLTGTQYIQQVINKAAESKTYTVSIHFKKVDTQYTSIRLQGNYPHRADCLIDLDNETTSTSTVGSFSNASAEIVAMNDNWYRVSFTATSDTHTSLSSVFSCNSQNVAVDSPPSVSRSVLLWGVQLEEADSATTYVPSIDTFTSRASNATYVDSNGLIKTAYKNLVKNSQEFNQSTWQKSNATVTSPTFATAPDGTETATKITINQQSASYLGLHSSHSWSVTAGKTYTFSIYVKSTGNPSHFTMQFGSGSTVTRHPKTATPNEWTRYSITHTAAATNDPIYFNNYPDDFSTEALIWGAQVVEGTEAGDYVRTGATPTGAARYSHDPETLTPTGLYLEPAATNVILNSHNVINGTVNNVDFSSELTDESLPFPSYRKIKSDNSSTGLHTVKFNHNSLSANTNRSFSCFAKALKTGYNLQLRVISIGANSAWATFDLNTGQIAYQSSLSGTTTTVNYTWSMGTPFIEKHRDGWYRIGLTNFTASQTHTFSLIIVKDDHALEGLSQFGVDHVDNSSDYTFGIWGGQVEEGSYPSSYIPTTSSQVTRAADVYTSTANLTETFEPRGLLIEEARTNVIHNNTAFDTAWNNSQSGWLIGRGSITANSDIAPDGTQTADKFVANTENHGLHGPYVPKTWTSGNTVLSAYVKAAGLNYVSLISQTAAHNTTRVVQFDLTNGTVKFSNNATGEIINVGNGWYRVIAKITDSTNQNYFLILPNQGGNPETTNNWSRSPYQGNNSDGMLIWGAQQEAGSFATSLILNDGQSHVTRSADIASISGDNFGTYRTNMFTKSEEFWDSSSWIMSTNGAAITPNYALAPDGTFTAARYTTPSSNTYLKQHVDLTAGKTYTFSIYVKDAGNSSDFNLYFYQTNNGSYIKLGKTSAPSDWQRFELTVTPDANTNVHIGLTTHPYDYSTDVLIWGAQLEESSTTTNYIPSTDTFTSRLGNATYVDSNGLIKTAYRNLIPYSQQFNTNWSVHNGTITANTDIAPDGTLTANKYVASTSNTSTHQFFASNSAEGALSIFAKYDGGLTHLTLTSYDTGNASDTSAVSFDIVNGSIKESINGTGEIRNVGNGWYRCIVYPSSNTDQTYFVVHPHNGGNGNTSNHLRVTYAGNNSDGLLVWGAMQTDNLLDAGEYTANLTNVLSGAPRYSHDPETLVPTGLYLEPAATNFIPRSNSFHYSNKWVPTGGSIALDNSVAAPTGETGKVAVFTEDTSTGAHNINSSSATSSDLIQTNNSSSYSLFVKPLSTRNIVLLRVNGIGTNTINLAVKLDDQTIHYKEGESGTSSRNITWTVNAHVEKYQNNWYRVVFNYLINTTNATAGHNPRVSINFGESNDITNVPNPYEGNGQKIMALFGLQNEVSSYASSYIETDGSAVTRPADTYTSTATTVLDRDGGNKEAFWSPTANTMFGEMKYNKQSNYPRLYEITSPNGEASTLFIDPSNDKCFGRLITQAGVQLNLGLGFAEDDSLVKIANTYQLNDGTIAINGAVHAVDNNIALHVLPTDTKRPILANIGNRNTQDRHTNAPIQRITHWKTRLPDASLINITNT